MRIPGMQPDTVPVVTTLSGKMEGRVQYTRTLGGHFQPPKPSSGTGVVVVSLPLWVLAKVAGTSATEASSVSADDTRTFFTAISTSAVNTGIKQMSAYVSDHCSAGAAYIALIMMHGRVEPDVTVNSVDIEELVAVPPGRSTSGRVERPQAPQSSLRTLGRREYHH